MNAADLVAHVALEPIPVGAVADGLVARAADTTRLIDRGEHTGPVERRRNRHDRRGDGATSDRP